MLKQYGVIDSILFEHCRKSNIVLLELMNDKKLSLTSQILDDKLVKYFTRLSMFNLDTKIFYVDSNGFIDRVFFDQDWYFLGFGYFELTRSQLEQTYIRE